MNLTDQIIWLLILAIPIACISWTITHEEIFAEVRDFTIRKKKYAKSMLVRKLFYPVSCEYCFSHWVTLFFLALTRFKLLIDDWRGYVIAWFALVLVANAYLNLYARLRVDITSEKKEIERKQREIERIESQVNDVRSDGG